MYHCVCRSARDPWAICVSPTAFAEQMEVLAGARAAVDLGAFAHGDAYTRGGSRLAVTFDDGYADNLTAALPVLERFDIPVTVFVVGNAVDRAREFWWDALQRALLGGGRLPETLELPFGDRRTRVVGAEPDDGHETGWRADSGAPGTGRENLFLELWDEIVLLGPAEQDDAVEYLLSWAGRPLLAEESRMPVTADQFAFLTEHPLVTLGSHTLDHVSLTDLDPERQRTQIEAGHRAVEELAGRPVTRFAYPFGRLDASARAAAHDLDIACTSVPFAATAGDDRRALPRLQATEMDGDRFARWLHDEHALLVSARR